MNSDLSLVLKLQSLDARATGLESEIAKLPKRIAEIEKQLDAHKRRLDLDRSALAANQKERKRLDDDIKVQQLKITKLRDQTAAAKTNEQYRAFQHEIEFCEKEIRRSEDRILELMTESEPLDQNVKKAEAALALEAKQVETEKVEARQKTASHQKDLADIKVERAQIAATVSKEYITNYERLRKRPGGIAVAEAAQNRCCTCNMIIRPAVMQELRTQAQEIVFCESCKRMLFYNPPVSVEETS